MKERLPFHTSPEVRDALRLAERLTGATPAVRWAPTVSEGTHAELVRPDRPSRPYEIRLRREQARFAEHLILHEIGHIVRLHQVPARERLVATMSPEARVHAAEQLVPEFPALLARGIPEAVLPELFERW